MDNAKNDAYYIKKMLKDIKFIIMIIECRKGKKPFRG